MDRKDSSQKPADAQIELAHPESNVTPVDLTRKDKAAQLLKEAGASHPIVVSPADNKRILRKIDLTILPILLTVYCLQYLDKSTLSYASVFGLLDDAHLGGEDYSWLGSIVYLAQLIMQPLVAFFLVKLPTGKFTAGMVLGWGVTLCCMTAAHSFVPLLITRFILGAFEAAVGE
jgi:sugar phosphate permease